MAIEHLEKKVHELCRAEASKHQYFFGREGYQLGVKYAPLFVGYSLFIGEDAKNENIENIFFFTREGEFFFKLYEILKEFNPVSAKVLSISRIASFAPSLKEFSVDELMRIWRLYSCQSVQALLITLGLDQADYASFLNHFGIDAEVPITAPWSDVKLQSLLNDVEFRKKVEGELRTKKDLFLTYLDGVGFTKELRRVAIVDIGWRGTIQDNLAQVRGGAEIKGYYLGLQKFLNEQPRNCVKVGYCIDVNKSDAAWNVGDVSVLEMLCNSSSGSVMGYERKGEDIVPIRLNLKEEDLVFQRFTKHFQEGVLDACGVWADIIRSKGLRSKDFYQSAVSAWTSLTSSPPVAAVVAHSALKHNELFGMGKVVDKGVTEPLKVIKGVFRRKHRAHLIRWVAKTIL